MRVLVTGASGFIGGYVVERLLADGHEPIAFDRREPAERGGIERHLGDVRDPTAVLGSMAIVDGFIHLAGVLGTAETVWDPTSANETNVAGSVNVFAAARHYEVPGVYIGVGNYWMENPYSISKTTAERYARMFYAEWGTRIAVVRALNAYGPRQKPEPVRKLIPNLVLPALRGEALRVYGSGDQVMDMIYVEDVARALVAALLVEHGNYSAPFEAGSGRRTTVNEIADAVLAEVGETGAKVERVPMRAGEVPDSVVLGDPETLRPLGIDPARLVSLEDGVRRTVDYYAGHSGITA